MYWVGESFSHGAFIRKGGMDGSNPTNLVVGAGDAVGIQIDFQTRRLYWTNHDCNRIQYSNLDGSGIVTAHHLSKSDKPMGIAIYGDRLYWSYWGGETLKVQTSRITWTEELSMLAVNQHDILPLHSRIHQEIELMIAREVIVQASVSCRSFLSPVN